MELTIGFVSLFLLLVLPGIIFRRFYYLGEFSKQISVSEPILSTIAYALIPGVLIQLTIAWLYLIFTDANTGINLTPFYNALFTDDKSLDVTELFLKDVLSNSFIWYSFVVYSFSASLGFSCYLLVRNLKLDRNFKILRFKNQWAYIFSGELYGFPKWKKPIMPNADEVKKPSSGFLFPYVDVLVRETDNKSKLYSGILKDYDVLSTDLSQLRRLYLINTKRYKQKEDGFELKDIPGDFLIIDGSDIINLNVQYIFSEPAVERQSENSSGWLSAWNIFIVILILLSLPALFVSIPSYHAEFYHWLFGLPWYQKFYLWLILAQLYGNLFPFVGRKDGYQFIGWKLFWFRLGFVIILGALASWWLS